jgi:hypothetical protein
MPICVGKKRIGIGDVRFYFVRADEAGAFPTKFGGKSAATPA